MPAKASWHCNYVTVTLCIFQSDFFHYYLKEQNKKFQQCFVFHELEFEASRSENAAAGHARRHARTDGRTSLKHNARLRQT